MEMVAVINIMVVAPMVVKMEVHIKTILTVAGRILPTVITVVQDQQATGIRIKVV